MRALLPVALAASCAVALSSIAQEPVLVKDINPSGSSSIDLLTCLDGKVYFRANDGVHGAEPWVSDGTTAGTLMLRDINPDAAISYPGPFVAFNGLMYFGAADDVNGEQLWVTDGTPAGTTVVSDIVTSFTSVNGFTECNGQLYFQGTTDGSGAELWATDGTVAGTHLVKDINPGADGSYPGHFAAFGDRLFFSASNGTSGSELWASDGTDAGTVLIKDILPGGSSNPDQFAVLGSHLIFNAYDLAHGGEPWITDGTTAGTMLLKDINPTGDSAPFGLCTFNGRTYFSAGNSTTGGEIWVTDGTPEGTVLFVDLFPGTTSSQARRFTVSGGLLYFTAMSNFDDLTQLWRTDGTVVGTEAVLDGAHTAGPLNGNNALEGCGVLFFDAGYTVATGEELYSLGTSTGIGTLDTQEAWTLWPNPSDGQVHMPRMPGGRIEILTVDGRLLLQRPATGELDVSALPSGAYLVRWTEANGVLRVERLLRR